MTPPDPDVQVHRGRWSHFPRELFEEAVRATLAEEGIDTAEISVTILEDVEIRRMNREFLDHDWPTDVLSFALYGPGEPVVGDIYVGGEQAELQAEERGIPAVEEFVRLVVHGTLHALGYEHPDGPGREESELFRKQELLVERLLA